MTRSPTRFFAFVVDGLVALLLTALVITPLAFVADVSFWRDHNPTLLIWALAMIFLSLLANGGTVGKRWAKLALAGAGCLVCRELRRMAPFILGGFGALLAGFIGREVALGLDVASAIWVLLAFVVPAARGTTDFPYNTATGFAMNRAPA